MPTRNDPASAALSIQNQLTAAAQAFAVEVLRILSASTLSDLTSLAGQGAPAEPVKRGPGRPPKSAAAVPFPTLTPTMGETDQRKPVPPKTSALRKMAGTKPVDCPVEGCNSPGIRSKMNFCHEHFGQYPKNERVKLRAIQKAKHVPQPLSVSEQARKGKGGKKPAAQARA